MIKVHAGWLGVACLVVAGLGCFVPQLPIMILVAAGLVLYNGYAFGRIK